MKLPKLRAEIQRIESELARLRQRERTLEISATMPHPHKGNANGGFTPDATLRATKLFWEKLTSDQRKSYLAHGWFYAIGKSTRSTYRISPYHVMREGECAHTFLCLVMRYEQCPVEDVMLAKKILIENDEREFLETAKHQGTYPLRQANELFFSYEMYR